jgi:hypothetical protein
VRRYSTDYRLWGLIFGCLFVPNMVVWLMLEPVKIKNVDGILADSICFGCGCAIVAWVLHACLVLCGVRLTGSADPSQAADYDDAQPPAG